MQLKIVVFNPLPSAVHPPQFGVAIERSFAGGECLIEPRGAIKKPTTENETAEERPESVDESACQTGLLAAQKAFIGGERGIAVHLLQRLVQFDDRFMHQGVLQPADR